MDQDTLGLVLSKRNRGCSRRHLISSKTRINTKDRMIMIQDIYRAILTPNHPTIRMIIHSSNISRALLTTIMEPPCIHLHRPSRNTIRH